MIDLDLTLGVDDSGAETKVRLSKAPHLLVAGMTGSGKSVLLHDLICQTLNHAPTDVQLTLIDPKRVEFGIYRGLLHLSLEPLYDDRDIEYALGWAASEMHSRFQIMERMSIRDVTSTPWARMIVVVDELANLMLKGERFEKPLVEIASMGRAAGVHLLLATQRPDASVINGLIRANIPTRIALPTITATDSRIILDTAGAEVLQVPERLVRLPGRRDLIRVRGRHWATVNINAVVAHRTPTTRWHDEGRGPWSIVK